MRRVWQEASALRDAGHRVTIICPTGKGYEARYEEIDGIAIHRYRLPVEASGALGYAIEYGAALAMTFALTWRVLFTRGFDVKKCSRSVAGTTRHSSFDRVTMSAVAGSPSSAHVQRMNHAIVRDAGATEPPPRAVKFTARRLLAGHSAARSASIV